MKQCTYCGFKIDAPFDSEPLREHSKKHIGKRGFREDGMWKDYDAQLSLRFVQSWEILFLTFGILLGYLIGVPK